MCLLSFCASLGSLSSNPKTQAYVILLMAPKGVEGRIFSSLVTISKACLLSFEQPPVASALFLKSNLHVTVQQMKHLMKNECALNCFSQFYSVSYWFWNLEIWQTRHCLHHAQPCAFSYGCCPYRFMFPLFGFPFSFTTQKYCSFLGRFSCYESRVLSF